MADEERRQDAAVAAQQWWEAANAQHRADALRHDPARRKQSAAEHYAATIMRLRRGIDGKDPRS